MRAKKCLILLLSLAIVWSMTAGVWAAEDPTGAPDTNTATDSGTADSGNDEPSGGSGEDSTGTPAETGEAAEGTEETTDVPEHSGPFADVAEDFWAADAIVQLTELHVTTGFPDGTFRPGDTVSRGQFLAMVLRAVYPDDIPLANEGEAWWQPYYNLGFSQGLLGSMAWNTDEAPMDRPLNRYEAATVLDEANRVYNGVYLTSMPAANSFSDLDSGERSAHVESAAALGLLSGYPDGTFRGDKEITRAEACVILQRLLNQVDLLEDGEILAVCTGDVLIKYALLDDGGADITSIDLNRQEVVDTLHVKADGYADNAEMREEALEMWLTTYGRTVSGTGSNSFWGEIGYYTFNDRGQLTQWTDRAVLACTPSPDSDGILAISHDPGQRLFYYGGGVPNFVGDQVLHIHADGSVETVLSNTPAHGLNLATISTEGGQILVTHQFVMGMADQHSYEYAVENGKLRALEHTPGGGFSGYTPEEAAAEQARLDALGCGVGSIPA